MNEKIMNMLKDAQKKNIISNPALDEVMAARILGENDEDEYEDYDASKYLKPKKSIKKSEEDNILPTYYKARVLVLAGKVNEGREILNEILASYDFTGNDEMKMNVLYYLGRTTESKAILDQLTANTTQVMEMTNKDLEATEQLPEVMSLYNLACAYSLHGESSTALDYLKRCFESAEAEPNFDYAVLDYDFDNIRKNPKFMELINTYKTKWLNGTLKKVGSIN